MKITQDRQGPGSPPVWPGNLAGRPGDVGRPGWDILGCFGDHIWQSGVFFFAAARWNLWMTHYAMSLLLLLLASKSHPERR